MTRDRVHKEQLINQSSGGPGIKWVTDTTYSMKATDHLVVADSTDNVVAVTLPAMSEAIGKFYCVEAPEGASNDVSVLIKETGSEISTFGDLDADDDWTLFYCTGRQWVAVGSSITGA